MFQSLLKVDAHHVSAFLQILFQYIAFFVPHLASDPVSSTIIRYLVIDFVIIIRVCYTDTKDKFTTCPEM